MERFLDKRNSESIKKTMQTQDEIFKHQVGELHRLYNVQKMMMMMTTQKTRWDTLNSQCSAFAYNNHNNNNNNLDLERTDIVDDSRRNGAELEENDLDLTLSIGVSSSSSYQKETNRGIDSSALLKSDNTHINNQDSGGHATSMSSTSSTTSDREKKRPHWLL